MVGITIYKMEQMGYDLFDFEYSWDDVSYFGTNITKETLQNDFKEYYSHYNIAYETIESFKFELRRRWKKYVRAYNNLLKSQPDIKLNESERTYTESNEGNRKNTNSAQVNHTSDVTNNSDNKFSDTPNQNIAGETEMYLTNREIDKTTSNTISEDNSQSTSDRTYSDNKDITESLTGNEFEKYSKIKEFVEDMEYKFFDMFNDLFEMLIRVGNLYEVRRYPWIINI